MKAPIVLPHTPIYLFFVVVAVVSFFKAEFPCVAWETVLKLFCS